MFGWRGRLLRVNLTSGAIKKETLDPGVAKDYLGGRGLGIYLHARDVSVSVDPLSAGNHLIFATGPLTGTLAPNGGRYTVISRTPPSGALTAASISGKWGPGLKAAGFDAIIIEGRSESPVYLWVNDGKAELRSAAHAQGKPVSETTELLVKETDPRAAVSCIGPAGENCVGCSVIVTDGQSAAGKSGVGAVMGSKNLKAVVVCGTEGLRMADNPGFLKSAMELRSFMKPRGLAIKGAQEHDSVLIADSLTWDESQQDSKAARTRGCFGCATSFSSFTPHDGKGFLPLLSGSPYGELRERLSEYRSFVDLGLDFTAAKAILASLGNGAKGSKETLVRKLALGEISGWRESEAAEGNGHSIERGPCMAAGYMIFPRIPAADGQDEALSDLMAVLDSAGLCPFLCAGIGMEKIAELLAAATGVAFSRQDVFQVSQRIGRSIRWTE
jgi:aldehyde:ferredoxin oxidoreductase